jgi:hypothetical protein
MKVALHTSERRLSILYYGKIRVAKKGKTMGRLEKIYGSNAIMICQFFAE